MSAALLFMPERHTALDAAPWDEALARAAIQAIVDDACERFDPQALWPPHPGDADKDHPDRPLISLYDGAAGVIWALQHLRERGAAKLGFDAPAAVDGLLERWHADFVPDATQRPSFFLCDAGILLLQWKLTRQPALADALYASIESNLHNPTREALWGSPGTLVAALHMLDATGESRWRELFRRGIAILWDEMEPVQHSTGGEPVWLWTQDLYGRRVRYLGAGHGFAGNVYPVLRGARWLDADVVRGFEQRAFETLSIGATRFGGMANWEPNFDRVAAGFPSKPLVQDCHGAPGIVCRLANTTHARLRELLVEGGELVWAAGPLAKPPGLCHGTDGNGYAFLKLHAMTGEARWLERARAFAMHALRQSEGARATLGRRRYALWTGDLGLAVYLCSCIEGEAALPTLDAF
ncbi:MAG TPA: LanC-like protein [Burkholderiaceae bacterium]|nr:LanC-like protein [Burkholderiaceae bacterium]